MPRAITVACFGLAWAQGGVCIYSTSLAFRPLSKYFWRRYAVPHHESLRPRHGNLLSVSEKTIYRWIKQQTIPAYRVQDQYRFNRAEILEWATSRRMNVSSEIFAEPEAASQPIPALLTALEAGGCFYRVSGFDKESALARGRGIAPPAGGGRPRVPAARPAGSRGDCAHGHW